MGCRQGAFPSRAHARTRPSPYVTRAERNSNHMNINQSLTSRRTLLKFMAGLTLAPTFAVAGVKDNRIQETRGKTFSGPTSMEDRNQLLAFNPRDPDNDKRTVRTRGCTRATRPSSRPDSPRVPSGPPPHEAGPRCSAPRPRRWLRISNTSWFFEGCTCATGTTLRDAGRALAGRDTLGIRAQPGCGCLQARCERPCPGRTHRRHAGRTLIRATFADGLDSHFGGLTRTRARTSKRFPTPRGVDRRTQEAPPCGGGRLFRPYKVVHVTSEPLPEPSIECRERPRSPHRTPSSA